MGRHRANRDYPESFGRLTSGETWADELSSVSVRRRRRAVAVQEVGERGPRWFKDWWWLAGFSLGFITGGLLLYAGFLLWLTGDIVEWFRQLFGKG